jgi:hypothetical protein
MPKSTNSSRNANSIPTSRSPSPKPEPKATVPSPLKTHPRPEQGQSKVALLEDAALQAAFSSPTTAADFMSGYGRNAGLVARVHEIGLAIDELAIARANHIAKRKGMAKHIHELDSHLPVGPYLRDILKKVKTIDPLIGLVIKEIDQPIPDRPHSHHERPRRDEPHTPPPTTAKLPQLQAVATPHKHTPPRPTPVPTRRVIETQQRPAEVPRRGYAKCRICNRMGHLQTQCASYYCAHCETWAPGHFAKYCSRNPHPGVDRRDLPPSALALLMDKENDTTAASVPTRTTPSTRPIAATTVQPHITGVSTTPLTRAKLSVDNVNAHATHTKTPPRVTIAVGPTYRPIFIAPRKPIAKPARELGKLQQLPPSSTTHPAGRKPPHHSVPSQRPSQQRARTPDYDDGDFEDNYSDAAWYNINGEGHFD